MRVVSRLWVVPSPCVFAAAIDSRGLAYGWVTFSRAERIKINVFGRTIRENVRNAATLSSLGDPMSFQRTCGWFAGGSSSRRYATTTGVFAWTSPRASSIVILLAPVSCVRRMVDCLVFSSRFSGRKYTAAARPAWSSVNSVTSRSPASLIAEASTNSTFALANGFSATRYLSRVTATFSLFLSVSTSFFNSYEYTR